MSVSTIEEPIPVIMGECPRPDEPEYREMMKYEDGTAEREAAGVKGKHDEPWMNVLDAYEPSTRPALDHAIAHPDVGPRIRGRAIDLGAGTCWATAKLSKLDRVDEVVALDLSRHFLTTVGARMIRHFDGNPTKVRFAVSSFNHLPFDADTFDCAFLLAAIHHSLSPIKTLMEAWRVLRPDGMLVLVEHPFPVLGIGRARERYLEITRSQGATELCYTRGELEYLIRHAGFGRVTFRPLEFLVQNPLKRLVRRGLRAAGIQDLLRPPTYLITAEK